MEQIDWADAVEDLLMSKSGKAPRTRRYYECQLTQLVVWSDVQQIALQDFTPRHFRAYMAKRADEVKASTLYHDAVCAKVFFRFCRKNKYTAKDPLADFEFPKPKKPNIPLPSVKQIQDLLAAIDRKWDIRRNPEIRWQDKEFRGFFRDRDYAIACLLVEIGCRIDEGLRIKLADVVIEGESGTITLRDTKGGNDRQVPIGPTFIAASAPWMKTRVRLEKASQARVARGESPTVGDSLFLTRYGDVMSPSSFAKSWRLYLKWAGIERFTRHQVRHFTLTQVVRKNPRSAQLLAGHADISTTIKNYDHTHLDDVRADHTVVNPLGALLINKRSAAAKKPRLDLKG
jgi:site-specific recombinase XerD